MIHKIYINLYKRFISTFKKKIVLKIIKSLIMGAWKTLSIFFQLTI